MNTSKKLQLSVWALGGLTVLLALYVWWPATQNLNVYSLFPIFGLIAFGLMWTHYIGGALRRYVDVPSETLLRYFQITGYVVLFCILVHPFLLDFQLFLDGNGLPPFSRNALYTEAVQQFAIFLGTVSLVFFLLFELHRFFKDRSWWKYIEYANILAMFLILYHGFTLGSNLREPWFQVVWAFYAVSLVVAIGYSEYVKRKGTHGTKQTT